MESHARECKLSEKGQMVNIFSFVGHAVSVAVIWLCHYSTKAAAIHKRMNVARFGPKEARAGHSLPTLDLYTGARHRSKRNWALVS